MEESFDALKRNPFPRRQRIPTVARAHSQPMAWSVVAAVLLAGCTVSLDTSGTLRDSGAALKIGTTTSTQDSGLLDVLLPAFERATGVRSKAIVGGSGEILAKGARGDVDVLLAHSLAAELAFVAAGHGTHRTPVMANRFLLIGPLSDPAGTGESADASGALARVHANRSLVTFVSRGDDSGTHVKESELWTNAGLDPTSFSNAWYKETGSGQTHTLLVANELDGYALTDEATWAFLRGQGKLTHLNVVFENDAAALKNPYGATPVNATIHSGVRQDLAERFVTWIVSEEGKGVIASYRIAGVQVFFPATDDSNPEEMG